VTAARAGVTHLVVFIAGAGQDAAAWDDQVSRLSEQKTLAVSATDLASPFGFDAAVAGLHDRIVDAGATSVTLVGLSLGGMIATRYAARHPDVVDGLLLSGSQIRPNPALMRLQRTILRLLPARALPMPDGLDKAGFLALIDAAARVDLREDLPQITATALVLCGAKDRPNLPAARDLAASLLDAELRIVPAAGHELATDAPEDFAVRTLL